jgi:hypothetical protein
MVENKPKLYEFRDGSSYEGEWNN